MTLYCGVEGCLKVHYARGRCSTHYRMAMAAAQKSGMLVASLAPRSAVIMLRDSRTPLPLSLPESATVGDVVMVSALQAVGTIAEIGWHPAIQGRAYRVRFPRALSKKIDNGRYPSFAPVGGWFSGGELVAKGTG